MKAELQHQAERLKSQIEELQQTLRRARLGIIMTLQDLEDIEDPELVTRQPESRLSCDEQQERHPRVP